MATIMAPGSTLPCLRVQKDKTEQGESVDTGGQVLARRVRRGHCTPRGSQSSHHASLEGAVSDRDMGLSAGVPLCPRQGGVVRTNHPSTPVGTAALKGTQTSSFFLLSRQIVSRLTPAASVSPVLCTLSARLAEHG
jgi:hypothetical protein